MEKLTFYALSAPEKLDRIGAYLSERLIRDVSRHRYGYVCIAMEALDQLLMACHCQSINLFVESFLKMVAKLLESEKPNLQILGTNSFVKFANIEEDTPSYHRSYDFFVSRFSEMCHSSHDDPEIRTKIRMSGIKGLQGVVRKTVNDELQANIWDPQHMDKIVPSLLFNLQHAEEAESRSPSPLQATEKEKESPAELAERCLRELLGRAAYGNIKNAIKPVLIHLDNHSLWEPKIFAVRCFKIIMYSIQPQHSHLVIQQLLGHLDANSKSAATVRAGIVEVLSEAAVIAASGSVGPTVLEVFNTLLRQLRLSIDYELTGSYDCAISIGTKIIKEHEERMFQEAVIKTIGTFASTLPTYQRSEVMLFIMSKVPLPSLHHALDTGKAGGWGERTDDGHTACTPGTKGGCAWLLLNSERQNLACTMPWRETGIVGCNKPVSATKGAASVWRGENRNRLTQIMLLKSLLQVSIGFQCTNMLTALPSSFLDRLLSPALMEDPEIRLFVLEILISFIDRQGNRHKFSTVSTISDISVLKLKVDKCSRQDTVFMKKHAQQLYRHIYLTCKEEGNLQSHYEALYSMLALISIELANEEVVVDLIRLVLAVQEVAQINEDNLPVYNRCALYALCAAYLNLISQLTTVPAFCQHIHEVIDMRQKEAMYLLPEDIFVERPRLTRSLDRLGPEVLFRQSKISEVLGGSGYNSDRLSTPYIPQLTDEDRLSKRKSIGETISLQVEVESRNSPEKEERAPAEEITYETLKKAIVDSVAVEEQERERRRQVVEKFQKAPFEEIAAHCGARATLLQSKLNQIFEITIRPPPSPSGTITAAYGQPQNHSIPVYEMKFPDLCVY
ncbi:protein EFR3 homolog B isoform X1 [Alligator sinensis]|uniref:Protein EFR3 homolog B isoform X1 n=1 Tax=Alligator sinensis TaxID=38654 RepID=A0A3Q0FRE0_ALLSI|nr:protein EFR3 homolog B isoform X1 [Alligator sinensis]